MKVILLNRYFHPDISATSQMVSDLAFHLAERFDAHVITSRQRYDQPRERLPREEKIRGLTIHRVWTTHFGRGFLPGRALDYVTFYMSATARLLALAARRDVVVAMTDPPLISVPAAFAAKVKGAKVVNWLQDVFPEVAQALGFRLGAGPLGTLLRWLRDRSLSSAAANIALGDLMAERVAARGIERVRVIHNWCSGEQVKPLAESENPLRREWGLAGKFVVGYSGNMGRAHDLLGLLDVAEKLVAREDIVFLFIGAGSQREGLEAETRRRGLANVVFQPYQPREMLGLSLTVPDCHVVSLKPELEGLIVPSKFYSSLAAGRPVLYLGSPQGEIGKRLRGDAPIGVQASVDDPAATAQAILQLSERGPHSESMGRNARQLFEREFDQRIGLAHWSSLIASLKA